MTINVGDRVQRITVNGNILIGTVIKVVKDDYSTLPGQTHRIQWDDVRRGPVWYNPKNLVLLKSAPVDDLDNWI